MKRFIIYSILSVGPLIAMLFVYSFVTDRITNSFVELVASPKQSSLIVGQSRAGQGINPDFLNKELQDLEMYNFSFNYDISPYGATYCTSVKNKISKVNHNRLFIVEVSPGSFNTLSKNTSDTNSFRERFGILSYYTDEPYNNSRMNYFLNYTSQRSYTILRNAIRPSNDTIFKHSGWRKLVLSEKGGHKQFEKWYNVFQELDYNFSLVRFAEWQAFLHDLKKIGDVVVVRMPISEPYYELESNRFSNFDTLMSRATASKAIPYLNFHSVSGQFEYKDGAHLTPASANIFSKMLGDTLNTLFYSAKKSKS